MTQADRPAGAAAGFRPPARGGPCGLPQRARRDGPGRESLRAAVWANLHDRGGFNHLHLHEGSLLSGSFYLQVPPGAGDFVFRDPRPAVIHGCVKGAVVNGHCDIHLQPSTGLLVLFPCWIEHYVEVYEGEQPRIAIAFNANETPPPQA